MNNKQAQVRVYQAALLLPLLLPTLVYVTGFVGFEVTVLLASFEWGGLPYFWSLTLFLVWSWHKDIKRVCLGSLFLPLLMMPIQGMYLLAKISPDSIREWTDFFNYLELSLFFIPVLGFCSLMMAFLCLSLWRGMQSFFDRFFRDNLC